MALHSQAPFATRDSLMGVCWLLLAPDSKLKAHLNVWLSKSEILSRFTRYIFKKQTKNNYALSCDCVAVYTCFISQIYLNFSYSDRKGGHKWFMLLNKS